MSIPKQRVESSVLIVDDDALTAEICVSVLQEHGFFCQWSPNGAEAITLLSKDKPDLILLDILMPGLDGYETCKTLKENEDFKELPIVFMSALTEPIDKVKAFSVGGVDFISKPIEPQELLARVETQLTLARLQQELKEINADLERRIEAGSRDLRKTNDILLKEIDERKKTEKAFTASRQQLRELYLQLSQVEEAERQRLARELHDQVGQNLTALGINLNVILAQLSKESKSKVQERLQDANRLTAETAGSIRDIMATLRPQVLDDYGLKAALQMEAERFSARTGIFIVVKGKPASPRPPAEIETAFFRIAQEALTNISKHGEAQRVTIYLEQIDDVIRLDIKDDGTGFDPSNLNASHRTGWGLMAMRERIEAHSGSLHIESAIDEGTLVRVEVKIKPKKFSIK